MRAVVVGAGSWGTALSLILGRSGHEVGLVAHHEDKAAAIKKARENLEYLPGFVLPEGVEVFGPEDDPGLADFAVVAVPTAAVRENLGRLSGFKVVCSASKGLEPETGRVLGEVIEEACPAAAVTALSGPNLAMELARGVPTAAVCASPHQAAAELVRSAFMGPTLRVYVSDDRKGVELAGALKNVIAIGAGISDGMGYGDNTKGAFVSRGLMEMTRLGLAMGAKMETFLGLAGVGDLFATAASKLSRNYRVGYAIGQGQSLADAVNALGQVAEGVPTCSAAVRVAAEYGVEVPVMATLEEVMLGRTTVAAGVSRLMGRTTLHETNV